MYRYESYDRYIIVCPISSLSTNIRYDPITRVIGASLGICLSVRINNKLYINK